VVNDFRTFTAWALGAISALLIVTLLDANTLRGWALGAYLSLLFLGLFASFWRICGKACVEIVQFIEGGIDAQRIRNTINNAMPLNRLIIQPGELEVMGALNGRRESGGERDGGVR
jgi:hypothetical protein